MKVVHILESAPTPRDFMRFGTTEFKKASVEQEFWDISGLLTRKVGIKPCDEDSNVVVRRPLSTADLEQMTGQLSSQDRVIFFAIYEIGVDPHLTEIFAILGSSPAQLVGIHAHARPQIAMHAYVEHTQRHWGQVLRSARSLFQRRSTARLARRSRGFDELWLSPGAPEPDAVIVHKHTRVQLCHALDYDEFLRYPPSPQTLRHLVILDSLGPLHPHAIDGTVRWEATTEAFFNELKGLIEDYAAVTQASVSVVMHPRGNRRVMEQMYSPFEVFDGPTASALSTASEVIAPSSTTAAALVAAYDLPLLLLQLRCLPVSTRQDIQALADIAGLHVAETSEDVLKWAMRPKIRDPQKYKHFVGDYLKPPESPEILLWQRLVENWIRANENWQ